MTDLTLQDIAREMKAIDFGMLSTRSESGRISARPMSNNGDVEFDGDCYFFSYEDTRKVADIRQAPGVSLTFSGAPSLFGKPGIFVAVQGDAVLSKDKTEFQQHWVDGLDRWFPDASVWSDYGSGYGFVPVLIPVLALWWLLRTQRGPAAGVGQSSR